MNISVESAFTDLMQTEYGRELAYYCYYDLNVIDACARFEKSEEWEATKRILVNHTSHPGKALDIGAGNGIASFALARNGFSVYAVEPDPSDLVGYGAISKLRTLTGLDITHLDAYGESLPFEDHQFSVVYVRQVLHHARNLTTMLSEIVRVLKPEGLFIAVREHVIDDTQTLEEFLKNHPLHSYTKGEYAYTLQNYIETINSSGLRILNIIGPWDSVINHYPISNKKLKEELYASTYYRWGRLAGVLTRLPMWEKRYRKRKTFYDHTPGRLYSFVTQSKV